MIWSVSSPFCPALTSSKKMGNTDSKTGLKKAIADLKSKDKIIETDDDSFWQQFWKDQNVPVQEIFTLVTPEDIRSIREDSPQNFATLAFKCADQMRKCVENSCTTSSEQQSVLNCVRLLTRLVPFFLEEPEWRAFFWSQLPPSNNRQKYGPPGRFSSSVDEESSSSPQKDRLLDGPVLATTMLNSLSTLLFCPGFTVSQHKKVTEESEDLLSLDSCEYIWAAGVGFALAPAHNAQHDSARIEILRLLLACFSETIYCAQGSEGLVCPNRWLEFFTSAENKQVLPLFTSLLNVVFAYDPVGYGVPYNYLMFSDSKEPLAEVAIQALIVCLDHVWSKNAGKADQENEGVVMSNMFINYLSRIHREEDLTFMVDGFVKLLNNPLQHNYLPSSAKKIQFHPELLILFWKCCEYNKRFMYHVLKSCVVLDVLIPILHCLNESRQIPSRTGQVHACIFILLMLSGERNFGVRLNKPYTTRVLHDLPVFSGNHADLIVLVFHRLITSGHAKLQPLFDCLLTIILNISPYIKAFAMVPASKLLHLFEAFSAPWFLFANPNNHRLVFFLLETFNNAVQYQFDGNAPLIYCIIRKRAVFHQLSNLPMDHASIEKSVSAKKSPKLAPQKSTASDTEDSPTPVVETGESELHVTLPQLPELIASITQTHRVTQASMTMAAITKMTGKTSNVTAEGLYDDPKEPPSVSGAAGDDAFDASLSPDAKKSSSMNFVLNSSTVPPRITRLRNTSRSISVTSSSNESRPWVPTPEWIQSWKSKLPFQTILRLLQVLVPQVEKICIDKNITDETEILKFLQRGTLVGLLPVPHPILVRRYASNSGTNIWFRTYAWGTLYLRTTNPPIWLETKVVLFDVQST